MIEKLGLWVAICWSDLPLRGQIGVPPKKFPKFLVNILIGKVKKSAPFIEPFSMRDAQKKCRSKSWFLPYVQFWHEHVALQSVSIWAVCIIFFFFFFFSSPLSIFLIEGVLRSKKSCIFKSK